MGEWWTPFRFPWEVRRHNRLRNLLQEAIASGPKNRTTWLELGYMDVHERRWLRRDQGILTADEVLHVAVGMVLPDGWETWPFVPGGWRIAWSFEARPGVAEVGAPMAIMLNREAP